MSWMPAQKPVLGDKRTCDALDLIIVPRVRDLGDGFSVRRAQDWKTGKFAPVPGETEFIPLPDS